MSYEKPIELRVSTQNISGTEARSVEALAKIERLLNKTLAAGELFKSPSASIDYKTHEVTKSFFVRKDAEKIVRDTLKAHEELFINPLTIASKEAKTRRYKVDVEGDRALASLRANTASLGGRVYGNQHGSYVEIPSYKGSLASAKSDAVKITQTMRVKQEEAREKEEQKAQKEKEREEIRKQKEAEKEERRAATEAKHRELAIVAGISASILLLRKLISLVENIVTGIINASGEAFTTTMEADRLGIDPVILRNMKYAGLAKGIGEAPINALKATNSLFGTQLLAAANIDKLTPLAPMLGDDIVGLINKGEGGKSPFKMTSLIIDSAFNNYKNGLNELNQPIGNNAARLRSIANTLGQASEDYATNFIRMVQDYEAGKDVEGFQQWIYDAMPISSPTSATFDAASENKKEYDEAVAELKSVINLIEITLSPLLNPLSEAIQKLTGFLMRSTGNTDGTRELSRNNYNKMLEAKARDEAEIATLSTIETEYLDKNKDVFPDERSFDRAVSDLHDGKIPSAIANDPERLQEFYDAFGVRLLKGLYEENLSSYEEDKAEFSKNAEKYATGEKTFTFSDISPAEVFSGAEILIKKILMNAHEASKGLISGSPEIIQMDGYVTSNYAIREKEAKKRREEVVAERYAEEVQKYIDDFKADTKNEGKKVPTNLPWLERGKTRRKLYEEYDAESIPMPPATSEPKFSFEDAYAAEEAASTVINMLSGKLIIQTLKAQNAIKEGTTSIVVGKLEDSNLYVHFLNKKEEKIGGTTLPIKEGYGITEDITLYLADD